MTNMDIESIDLEKVTTWNLDTNQGFTMEQNLMKQAAFASFLIERDFGREIPPYVIATAAIHESSHESNSKYGVDYLDIARAAIHESSYRSNTTCAVDYLKDVCDCQLSLAEFSGRISFFPFDPQLELDPILYKQPLIFGVNGFDFFVGFFSGALAVSAIVCFLF